MNIYLLVAIALFGIFIYLEQTAIKTFAKLQKSISSKAIDYLNKNKKKMLLEFIILASIFLCIFGNFLYEGLSLGGVVVAILLIAELLRTNRAESNPFTLLTSYQNEAGKTISDKNEPALCDWIDAVHEIGYKALENSSTPLTAAALNSQLQIGKQFLSNSNSLDLPKIGYVINFLFERLNVLFDLALEKKQEPLCVQINTTFGKLALHAMITHPHFAATALTFAGKLAEKAVHEGFRDVGVKTGLMLIELSNAVANETSLDDNDLGDAMLEVVKNLERVSSEIYRQDKNIPLEVIRAPFLQLKTVLASSKNSNHPTVIMTLNDVDRVLAQYQELELILKTIPPINS